MCQLFINADSDNWTSHAKSLRIDGFSTSIKMEKFYWAILEEIAHRDGLSVNQIITKLFNEALEFGHDTQNFTSFLRVCCGRYLSLIADGDISRQDSMPLGQLDASALLKSEKINEAKRKSRRTLKSIHSRIAS